MENEISVFAHKMQQELENNKDKGNWKSFKNKNDIMAELWYHLDKLKEVRITNEDTQLLEEYIADCANILMFLGNSYNLYE